MEYNTKLALRKLDKAALIRLIEGYSNEIQTNDSEGTSCTPIEKYVEEGFYKDEERLLSIERIHLLVSADMSIDIERGDFFKSPDIAIKNALMEGRGSVCGEVFVSNEEILAAAARFNFDQKLYLQHEKYLTEGGVKVLHYEESANQMLTGVLGTRRRRKNK